MESREKGDFAQSNVVHLSHDFFGSLVLCQDFWYSGLQINISDQVIRLQGMWSRVTQVTL